MCFKRALWCLLRGLLRLFRTLTTLVRRGLAKLRLRRTGQNNMSGDECEYDSTWEDGDENKTPRKKKMYHSRGKSRRNMFAARDMQDFRHGCWGLRDIHDDGGDDDDDAGKQDKGCYYNLEFYRGNLRSSPDDLYITDFHQKWWGDYYLLEDVHSYIQWLFPIQEPGVNWRAHVLQKNEIKLFRKDKKAKKRLVKSYELMLDFYGIRMVDESTGEVERSDNWKDRFRNLNSHTHNSLRITRILKCLGILGLKHYQAPLVKFFLNETLVEGQLENVKQSALDYFLFAVLDRSERRELVKFAFKNFKPREDFVWGPRKILSGQMARCKNEKMDQPKEEIRSSAEDEQNHSAVHEKNKKDRKDNDWAAVPNKSKEKDSENENEGVGKKII
ncbi:opioid growth factor receptor 2 [Puntigrus tetrazona]|uniref:opioid growth factor receptor 2 n=1 Tax=Puntigrus tetrazona TaxID=1606681 RepID=UPI001C8A92EA|nr:opioid growth factor receptor 2 [Puntigrus tetrazona]